ncbi:23S rRNA pseudouridine(1911/1915/1917) synthase RluD [soil metagenome]
MTRIRWSKARDWKRPEGIPEGSVLSVFRVPPEVAGQRVDVFMQSQLKRTSRTRAQYIVKNSAYDATGRHLRPGERVQAQQHVLLGRPPWDETPVPTDIPVIYEDEHLLAVSKPSGVPVHPTARYHKNTVIKLLEEQRPDQWLSLGHRIDRETSGVLLLSKSAACDRELKKALEARDGIEKTYEAFTWGIPQGGAATFRVDSPLELDVASKTKVKMRIGITENALEAGTIFHLVATTRHGGRDYARLRCDLLTGRQHQIRVHLASIGTPIVGDKLYGPDEELFARGADGELTDEDLIELEHPRHALHAARLSLTHPILRTPLVIEAPLPEDLADLWDRLSSKD